MVRKEVEQARHRLVDDGSAHWPFIGAGWDRGADDVDDAVVDVLEDRIVKRFLGLPMIMKARDVDSGGGRNLARGSPFESLGGEYLFGRHQDSCLGRGGRLTRLL